MPRKPSRDALLTICEAAFVPHEHWRNRDSSDAQRQLGECYALLKAGCEYTVRDDMGGRDDTIWVAVEFKGFGYFDYGGSTDDETFYLPSADRIERAAGKDWY